MIACSPENHGIFKAKCNEYFKMRVTANLGFMNHQSEFSAKNTQCSTEQKIVTILDGPRVDTLTVIIHFGGEQLL